MKKFKLLLGISLTIVLIYLSTAFKFRTKVLNSYQPLPQKLHLINSDTIKKVYDFLESKNAFDAFIAIKNDSVAASWGSVHLPINTHSVRKSIISVLYGIAINKGYMKIDQTLAQLGIDDTKHPLTAIEKTCTIKDLLTSRSGIYLEALGETKDMKDQRPIRGQHKPGEFFYYNNWAFNVLGTIFELKTKMTIGEAIEQWLAIPLGMKHFKPSFVEYKKENYTQHKQYIIYMTAYDLAKIGLLMANNGIYNGKQIITKAWVEESTNPISFCGKGNEPLNMYSYLWWNDTLNQTFWATGWGGQFLLVDKKNKLVVVSRKDTKRSAIGKLLFIINPKQGFRIHHQKLYELIKIATAS